MKTTQEYLEAAKVSLGLQSDYALAQWLGVSKQAASNWKQGKNVIDDYAAVKIAEALRIDPMEVIAAANMEREKDAKRKEFWRELLGRSLAAGLAVMAVISMGYGGNATAGRIAVTNEEYTLHALANWLRRLRTLRLLYATKSLRHEKTSFGVLAAAA